MSLSCVFIHWGSRRHLHSHHKRAFKIIWRTLQVSTGVWELVECIVGSSVSISIRLLRNQMWSPWRGAGLGLPAQGWWGGLGQGGWADQSLGAEEAKRSELEEVLAHLLQEISKDPMRKPHKIHPHTSSKSLDPRIFFSFEIISNLKSWKNSTKDLSLPLPEPFGSNCCN